MTVTPEETAKLFAFSHGMTEDASAKLSELIRIFAVQRYRMGLAEAVNTYRELHSGGCRVLSEGDGCQCFLCQIQRKADGAK